LKKNLSSTIAVILILVSAYYAYMYYNGPKIVDGVVSKSIDYNGTPVGVTTEFSPEDTVYFSAKGNRFWIKKAQVVWYKDKFKAENRFMVEEEILISDTGYFSTKLLVPKGLEEGQYFVGIYVAGRNIMETRTTFDVKK